MRREGTDGKREEEEAGRAKRLGFGERAKGGRDDRQRGKGTKIEKRS